MTDFFQNFIANIKRLEKSENFKFGKIYQSSQQYFKKILQF